MRDGSAASIAIDAASPAPSDPAAVAEWTALLDRFERDLEDPTGAGWRPASSPLPIELAGRARAVLAAQRTAIAHLSRDRDEVRGQLAAVRRIPAAPAPGAAYIDLDG